MKGIDISEHNRISDYTTVGRNVDFVIIRDGYGTTRDKLFKTHAAAFKALKKPIDVYHFIYATNSQQARENAEAALRFVSEAGLPKDTRIWCDLEYDTVDKAAKKGVTIGKLECDLFTRTFCGVIAAAGHPTGIYTNLDYLARMYSRETIEKYPLWIASYTKKCPRDDAYMWQYSCKGKLEGCEGDVDMDEILMAEKMDPAESAARWMEDLAADDSHGYDQLYRWGEKGDYDCSSALITAYEQAGIPVKSKYGATYTGNMYSAFKKAGFKDVTTSVNLATGAGMKRGDVLLNKKSHTAIFLGGGQECEASINEKGTATGGKPGDQTTREILTRPYRNYPWDAVLRLSGAQEPPGKEEGYMFTVQEVKFGTTGADALLCQRVLIGYGYRIDADGICGRYTEGAIRAFQTSNGLTVDGICGNKTWAKLLGV